MAIELRPEFPPDDATVVVRGGEMASSFVQRTAADAFDEIGIYTVSVFLALDASVDELCEAEPMLARYGKVRLSTAGRLRAAGFALLPTLARPHYDIVLPDLAEATLARLDGSFDPPIPRPRRRR